jgi:hypothetical protein
MSTNLFEIAQSANNYLYNVYNLIHFLPQREKKYSLVLLNPSKEKIPQKLNQTFKFVILD